jgi:hypothetical protein
MTFDERLVPVVEVRLSSEFRRTNDVEDAVNGVNRRKSLSLILVWELRPREGGLSGCGVDDLELRH